MEEMLQEMDPIIQIDNTLNGIVDKVENLASEQMKNDGSFFEGFKGEGQSKG